MPFCAAQQFHSAQDPEAEALARQARATVRSRTRGAVVQVCC